MVALLYPIDPAGAVPRLLYFFQSLFLSLGKAKEGFILGACRQGICFVPVILLLPSLWGINGILYAQPAADVISAMITVFMAVRLHRELNGARS